MKTSEAIAIFGNKAQVAKALGISRAALTYWGETVPPLRVYQIRELLAKREAAKAVSFDGTPLNIETDNQCQE